MFDTIAASIIIGMLAEMRIQQARTNRKVGSIQDELKKHKEEGHLPSPVYGIIAGILYILCCVPLVGCSPFRVTVPSVHHGQTQEEYIDEIEEEKPTNVSTHKETHTKKPQAERAEDASYFWGKIGIMTNSVILAICAVAFVFAPTLAPLAGKLGVCSLFLLGCSVTVWVLAPAMIWIMYAVAGFNVFLLALFIAKHLKNKKESAHA